jgi:hypothetical protein
VPIDFGLVRALRAAHKLTEFPDGRDLAFCTATGQPLDYTNLRRRVLVPAAQEAGMPWIGFHTLRHTCASRLFAEGGNAVQVQRWLGHHSPAFTLARYVHLLDGDLGEPLALPSAEHPQVIPSSDVIPSRVDVRDHVAMQVATSDALPASAIRGSQVRILPAAWGKRW